MPGPSKQSGSVRRVSSSLSKVSTPPTTAPARPSKASNSKIVHLRLSKDVLLAFPHDQSVPKARLAQSSPITKTKSAPMKASTSSVPVRSETDTNSSAGGGPDDKHSHPKDVKQESKTGVKRELGSGAEGDSQSKSKSNPRKRPRVGENGRIDGRTAAAKAMGYTAASHKLGPKANQGVINEKLRALDRTGKPCRKWQKTGFKIKSFTGKIWEVPTWRTTNAKAFGSTTENRPGTSHDLSKGNSSSNIGSDKSPACEKPEPVSSPAPAAQTPAELQ